MLPVKNKSQRKVLLRALVPPSVLALVLMSAVWFAACTGAVQPATPGSAELPEGAAEPAEAPAEKPAEPIKLVTANHLTNEAWHAAFDEYLAEYHNLNPGVTVEQQSTAYADLQARVATDRMADEPPDLYQLPAWWIGWLGDADMFAEVPEDIVQDVQANYPPGVIQAVTWDGKIRGVPMDSNPTVMIYNKAMLEEAGYDRPPETLDELKEYALNLTKRDTDGNVTQYGYSQWVGNLNTEYLPFASFLFSNGGSIFDESGTKAAFNSPAGVDILSLHKELIDAGAFNPELTYTDWYTNRVAITVLPNWVRYYLNAYNDPSNFGSAPVPHGEGKQSGAIVYSWFIFVNKRSEHQEEAWDFVRWFTQEPMSEKGQTRCAQFYYDIASVIPGRVSDLKAMEEEFSIDVFPAYIDSLSYAQAPPAGPNYNEIVEIINTEIENVWFGNKTSQQALDDAAAQVDALLQMP